MDDDFTLTKPFTYIFLTFQLGLAWLSLAQLGSAWRVSVQSFLCLKNWKILKQQPPVVLYQPPPWPQKHVHENRCIKDNLMSETPSTRLLHNKIDLNRPPKVLPQPQDFPWGGNIFESYLSTQNMSPLSLLELLQIGFVISHCGKSTNWDCQIGSGQQNRHK